MGKSRKDRIKGGLKLTKQQSLGDQITGDEYAKTITRVKIRSEKKDSEIVDGTLGRTIVKQGLQQLAEIEKEKFEEEWPALGSDKPLWRKKKPQPVFLGRKKPDSDDDDDDDDSDDGSVDECKKPLPIGVDRIVDDFEKELNIGAQDLEVLKHFTKSDVQPQARLADLFKDRITEKRTEIKTQIDADSVCSINLSPEIQEMCRDVGKVLAGYRSGPLPKMFKVIPKMKAWEELVHLTNPEKWSAAAMYQATRIFVSNMKVPMAQRFFNLVLLPRIRDDISYYKRLNYHLYQALFKALFKPAAFFKGVLLPLCMSGNCSLREAIIVGSVIAKNHIPVMHTAAAMHKVAEMDYTGPNSIFMRIFFDKKYALPYRVVDACVYHFLKFEKDERDLPVLWHQSLLIFVQRYKEDLSQEQKDAIMQLCRAHSHGKITVEIRRELQNSKCRQEAMAVD